MPVPAVQLRYLHFTVQLDKIDVPIDGSWKKDIDVSDESAVSIDVLDNSRLESELAENRKLKEKMADGPSPMMVFTGSPETEDERRERQRGSNLVATPGSTNH
ncbi:hypothetical protein [Brevibacillus migulae]|uniref:hypothetical protein n=1 Tax=Brevibacillus migulae TaxID=1644114 RepID=UPI00106ECE8D|nr:hypothetical protein [Brevibacillus migulae]